MDAPQNVAALAPLPAMKPIVMAAIDPVPIPKPKPSFALTTIAKPAPKSADAAPVHKVALAVVGPRPATQPTSLPVQEEELPVTAPDSIKAFRAERAAAAKPDSSGTSSP